MSCSQHLLASASETALVQERIFGLEHRDTAAEMLSAAANALDGGASEVVKTWKGPALFSQDRYQFTLEIPSYPSGRDDRMTILVHHKGEEQLRLSITGAISSDLLAITLDPQHAPLLSDTLRAFAQLSQRTCDTLKSEHHKSLIEAAAAANLLATASNPSAPSVVLLTCGTPFTTPWAKSIRPGTATHHIFVEYEQWLKKLPSIASITAIYGAKHSSIVISGHLQFGHALQAVEALRAHALMAEMGNRL